MMHRLKYIQRWGLMRNMEAENVQEHSHEVAIIAHALAILRQNKFSEGRICPDPIMLPWLFIMTHLRLSPATCLLLSNIMTRAREL